MSVNTNDIKKIAQLARLHIPPEQYPAYAGQLSRILEYMDKLNELDTADTQPMYNSQDTSNVMRSDTVKPSLPREEALKNAPLSGNGFFRVPKVVKK